MYHIICIGLIVQAFLSNFMKISFSGFWGFVNTIQLINYASMFTLYYPTIVLAMFSFLSATDLQSEYLTNIFLMHVDTSSIQNDKSWDYRFRNQSINSTNILENCGDSFMILVAISIIYFLFYLVCLVLASQPLQVRFYKISCFEFY